MLRNKSSKATSSLVVQYKSRLADIVGMGNY